jgi:hypothetical protein
MDVSGLFQAMTALPSKKVLSLLIGQEIGKERAALDASEKRNVSLYYIFSDMEVAA